MYQEYQPNASQIPIGYQEYNPYEEHERESPERYLPTVSNPDYSNYDSGISVNQTVSQLDNEHQNTYSTVPKETLSESREVIPPMRLVNEVPKERITPIVYSQNNPPRKRQTEVNNVTGRTSVMREERFPDFSYTDSSENNPIISVDGNNQKTTYAKRKPINPEDYTFCDQLGLSTMLCTICLPCGCIISSVISFVLGWGGLGIVKVTPTITHNEIWDGLIGYTSLFLLVMVVVLSLFQCFCFWYPIYKGKKFWKTEDMNDEEKDESKPLL